MQMWDGQAQSRCRCGRPHMRMCFRKSLILSAVLSAVVVFFLPLFFAFFLLLAVSLVACRSAANPLGSLRLSPEKGVVGTREHPESLTDAVGSAAAPARSAAAVAVVIVAVDVVVAVAVARAYSGAFAPACGVVGSPDEWLHLDSMVAPSRDILRYGRVGRNMAQAAAVSVRGMGTQPIACHRVCESVRGRRTTSHYGNRVVRYVATALSDMLQPRSGKNASPCLLVKAVLQIQVDPLNTRMRIPPLLRTRDERRRRCTLLPKHAVARLQHVGLCRSAQVLAIRASACGSGRAQGWVADGNGVTVRRQVRPGSSLSIESFLHHSGSRWSLRSAGRPPP